jgi:uncharacterized membrane protein (DUF485 family)
MNAPVVIERIELTPEERRRRKARSVAIALTLAGLVVLFYVLTLAKLGGGVLAAKIMGSS